MESHRLIHEALSFCSTTQPGFTQGLIFNFFSSLLHLHPPAHNFNHRPSNEYFAINRTLDQDYRRLQTSLLYPIYSIERPPAHRVTIIIVSSASRLNQAIYLIYLSSVCLEFIEGVCHHASLLGFINVQHVERTGL